MSEYDDMTCPGCGGEVERLDPIPGPADDNAWNEHAVRNAREAGSNYGHADGCTWLTLRAGQLEP